MSKPENGVPPITAPWQTKDIVYVSIVAPVMLAATLEWLLFFLAFNYCLWKVFAKAEHWSIRVLAFLIFVTFSAVRLTFLPVLFVTLPLPPTVTQYYPQLMVDILQNFAFYTFAGLLCIPWLFCIYYQITNNVGRHKRIKYILDEVSAPKTVIVMPCYKEEPEVLITAINSVVDCDYPASCIHVFLSFDGDQEDELYLKTIEALGVPLTLETYPKSIDVTYKDARITVSRFPHGGKRHCQKSTFKLIDKIYTEYLKRNDNLFILFIDSDCILDKVCIQNFMYDMELKPGSKQNMLAMTGVITSTTKKNTFITLLQDMEYIHGQLFERSVESCVGAVTCLPGALTMLRFSAFRKMAKYYFADKAEQCDDLFDFGKCHLGEDRWLTHLFMIGAKEKYQIQMCTGAFCKTEAVQTYRSLLKQRRRWFLGYITNEVCMLTDARLWRRYPLLCIVRFAGNTIRTTALLFFIMILSLATTEESIKNLPVGFIGVSLGLNWLLMLYFGAKLKRYKLWLYPVMFVVNPFFNWVYMVYGIFTAGQRTWGGPRADAGAADSGKSVAQVVEEAEKKEDELNVVPETFRPAADARHPDRPVQHVPLLPDENVEGRFAGAERLPGGWYDQNDSLHDQSRIDVYNQYQDAPKIPLHPRESFGSMASSGVQSIYMPRRVESFMNDDDRAKFMYAQELSGGGEAGIYGFRDGPESPVGPQAYQPYRDSMGRKGSGDARIYEYSDYDSSENSDRRVEEIDDTEYDEHIRHALPTMPHSNPGTGPSAPSARRTSHGVPLRLSTGSHLGLSYDPKRTSRSPLARMPLNAEEYEMTETPSAGARYSRTGGGARSYSGQQYYRQVSEQPMLRSESETSSRSESGGSGTSDGRQGRFNR